MKQNYFSFGLDIPNLFFGHQKPILSQHVYNKKTSQTVSDIKFKFDSCKANVAAKSIRKAIMSHIMSLPVPIFIYVVI